MKITFEGIDGPNDNVGQPIANGYSGMNWTNFHGLDPAGSIFIPSGLGNGIVSGTSVGYNASGTPATFATQSTDFALKNAWVTSAWNNGMTVKVEGWDDGVRVAKKSFIVNYDAPTKLKFGSEFASVDSVTISSSGGTEASLSDAGAGTHFAIDDLKVKFEEPALDRVDGGHHAPAVFDFDVADFSHWLLA